MLALEKEEQTSSQMPAFPNAEVNVGLTIAGARCDQSTSMPVLVVLSKLLFDPSSLV